MEISAGNRNRHGFGTRSRAAYNLGFVSAKNALLGLNCYAVFLCNIKGKGIKFSVIKGSSVGKGNNGAFFKCADSLVSRCSVNVTGGGGFKNYAAAVAPNIEDSSPQLKTPVSS